jgi:AcrR family transcriptional regulator
MSESATLPKPTPRNRKKRGEGTLRRAEILASAKRLFLQDGIEHATMRRIAADVGVSSTALYVYFPDKTAILDAISEAMFESLLASHAASQQSDKPPLARFRDGLMAYVGLALSRPDEYRLTFAAKSRGSCKEIEAADKSFNLLVRNVAELMHAGLFRPEEPVAAAEALWACMHGVVMLVLNQAEFMETPPQRLIDLVVDAAIRGFLK